MLSKSSHQESEVYLFHTQSGDIAFVAIEEEMAGVNDLLYSLQNGIAEEVERLSKELEGIESGIIKIVDPKGIYTTDDYRDGVANLWLPRWEYVNGRLAIGANLIILFAFVERALKWLCGELYDRNYHALEEKIRTFTRERGKIEKYLKFLNNVGGIDFEVPKQFLSFLQVERKTRNSFAHGDWDALYSFSSSQNLDEFFLSFTLLFESIESAWDCPDNTYK